MMIDVFLNYKTFDTIIEILTNFFQFFNLTFEYRVTLWTGHLIHCLKICLTFSIFEIKRVCDCDPHFPSNKVKSILQESAS